MQWDFQTVGRMSLYGKCLSARFKHTYWLLLLADSKQRLEDRLEDISFSSLSPSLYHAHNVQLTAFLEDMVDFFDYRCILSNYAIVNL